MCLYPSYFSYFGVLVLVAASLPAQVSHLVKAGLLFLIAGTHCAMNVAVIGPSLDCEEAVNHRDWTKQVSYLSCFLLNYCFIRGLGIKTWQLFFALSFKC